MAVGIVSNIQRFSLHDGPGLRTTVFLKGCPLTCIWCHNPENRRVRPEIVVTESRCLRCSACLHACPSPQKWAPWLGDRLIGLRDCTLCDACVQACPTTARQRIGHAMTVAEVFAEVRKDTLFYDDSGGGVTISGGEPLTQFEFVYELLNVCRDHGIHTALDTCGFAPTERFLSAARAADLVLFDLKVIDRDKHERFTGVANDLILENLERLSQVHRNIWLRIPVVPDYNDADEDLDALIRTASSLSGVTRISLLPYHQTAVAKFERLGLPYHLSEIEPPGPEAMARIQGRFQAHGLSATIGG